MTGVATSIVNSEGLVGGATSSIVGNNDAVFESTKSILFDGVDECLRITNAGAIPSGDLTLSLWVKLPGALGSSDHLISRTSSGSWDDGYGIYYRASDLKLVFWVTKWDINTATMLAPTHGNWFHLLGSKISTGMQVYIDAVSGSGDSAPANITSNSAKTHIGCGHTTSAAPLYHSNAYIDDVAIYNHGMTAEQITSIYNDGTPIDMSDFDNYTDCVGHYLMGDDPLDDATHSTGAIIDQKEIANAIPDNTENADIKEDAPPS